jgi:hypothetical protein
MYGEGRGRRVNLSVRKLVTCGATRDGGTVNIEFIDASGEPISIQLPFEQAGALTLTLPQLMSFAVKARSGSDAARYVFPLGRWSIEATPDFRCLIVTLRTEDGFEVAFSLPLDACSPLAWELKHSAQQARATDVRTDQLQKDEPRHEAPQIKLLQ